MWNCTNVKGAIVFCEMLSSGICLWSFCRTLSSKLKIMMEQIIIRCSSIFVTVNVTITRNPQYQTYWYDVDWLCSLMKKGSRDDQWALSWVSRLFFLYLLLRHSLEVRIYRLWKGNFLETPSMELWEIIVQVWLKILRLWLLWDPIWSYSISKTNKLKKIGTIELWSMLHFQS
jgi:hypothetical protein